MALSSTVLFTEALISLLRVHARGVGGWGVCVCVCEIGERITCRCSKFMNKKPQDESGATTIYLSVYLKLLTIYALYHKLKYF